jgi:hypothetical protein
MAITVIHFDTDRYGTLVLLRSVTPVELEAQKIEMLLLVYL